jgi:hypothetical protein
MSASLPTVVPFNISEKTPTLHIPDNERVLNNVTKERTLKKCVHSVISKEGVRSFYFSSSYLYHSV